MDDECFMCLYDRNCTLVDAKILALVNYLLPEITIIRLDIPLHVCATCDEKLQLFSEFKYVCIENSHRLEETVKKKLTSCKATQTHNVLHTTPEDNSVLDTHNTDNISHRELRMFRNVSRKRNRHKTEIETATLHTEDIDKREEQASVENNLTNETEIETPTLHTENIVKRQEQTSIENNTGLINQTEIETPTLHTEDIDKREEQANVENNLTYQTEIETPTLHTESIDKGQEHTSIENNTSLTNETGIETPTLHTENIHKEQEQTSVENNTSLTNETEIEIYQIEIKTLSLATEHTDCQQTCPNLTSEIELENSDSLQNSVDKNMTLGLELENGILLNSELEIPNTSTPELQEDLPENKNSGTIFSKVHHVITDHDYLDLETFCTKLFTKRIRTEIQNGCQKEIQEYLCAVCDKSYSKQRDLLPHMNVHRGINFECEKCHKIYIYKKTLQAHMTSHVDEYRCPLCEKMCFNELRLAEHKRTHTPSELRFECRICYQKFVRREVLSKHIVSHGDKNRYKCNICRYYFATKQSRNLHYWKMHKKKY